MELPGTLHNKIVDFLTSLPQIHDNKTQQALIYSAGLDSQLHERIVFGGSASQFAHELVATLGKYGKLEDGRYALESVLEAAKNSVGQDGREACDNLLQEFHDTIINSQSPAPDDHTLVKSFRHRRQYIVVIFVFCLVSVLVWSYVQYQKGRSEKKPPVRKGRSGENVYFFDDFASDPLNPMWTILEPDSTKWTLQAERSSLLLITQKGSLWGSAKNLKNQFMLDTELPAQDFEVIVQVSFEIKSQHNSVSVAIFQDDDNFIEIGYWGEQQNYRKPGTYPQVWIGMHRIPYFTKECEGQRERVREEPVRGTTLVGSPETMFFKIERTGQQYSGYYAFVGTVPESIDEIRWTKIGSHSWIGLNGRVSLWADNSNNKVQRTGIVYGSRDLKAPSETAAEFDFVLIREK